MNVRTVLPALAEKATRNSIWGSRPFALSPRKNTGSSSAIEPRKIIRVFVAALFCAGLLLPLAVPARAQLYSGSLTGVVSDPSGAVIPKAKVTLTDLGKQYVYTVTTDQQGRYSIRPLPPTTYGIAVQAPGFGEYSQRGIILTVNQNGTLDVHLNVGSSAQSIEVTAASPVLAASDATTGQEVNSTFIHSLPLISREALDLTFLAPGVNPAPSNTFGTLSGEYTKNNFSSNGGRNATSDLLIDGVSVTGYEQNSGIQVPLYSPSPDAVQEFKVEQNNFSAEFGYAGNTVVNMITRSGTNRFHGSVYELYRNNAVDANNFFNNEQGIPLGSLNYNDFGATLGGPIRHDKTFFFVDYEGSRQRTQGSAFQAGVPSTAERTGNFGELCGYAGGVFGAGGQCTAAAGQIWDPYSGVFDPNQGGPVRQRFIPLNNLATYQSPGNPKLNGTPFQLSPAPGNLIDPVAAKMITFFPQPNKNVGTASYNPFDNWSGNAADTLQHDQFHIRADQRFSDRNSLSGSFTWAQNPNQSGQAFNNALDPRSNGPYNDRPTAVAINDAQTFGPSTVLTVTAGFTRNFHDGSGLVAKYPNFSATRDLGLPGYLTGSGFDIAPAILIGGGYYSAGPQNSLGEQPYTIVRYAQQSGQLSGLVSHIQGRHELKFGAEAHVEQINYSQQGPTNGLFNFDFSSTSEFPASGGGDALAGFLTGTSTAGNNSGNLGISNQVSSENFRYATFLQDNWHVTSKLTLNLGVRYELETPRTERYNRTEWFDPNILSPINPVPCLPGEPCLSNLKGGAVYASNKDRSPAFTNYKGLAPRIGLAWQLNSNTVLRAGYGIFYSPSQYGVAGNLGYDGYTTTTPWINTYQSDGATPWGRLSNPFPAGLLLPFGNSRGALTNIGGYLDGTVRSWNALPYIQTWNFGLQHQLRGGVLVEANYVGTKGTHLYFAGDQEVNHLGPSVAHADAGQVASLLTFVDNPFYGIIKNPTVPLSNPQIQAFQLDLPHPQFASIFVSPPPIASSIYHSLQLRAEKRLSNGLQVLVNYTFSKSIDDASVQNGNVTWLGGSAGVSDPNNLRLERAVSLFDVPQVLNIAYVYDLPFGKGKRWHASNTFVNAALGGWRTSGIWRFDNGQPITLRLQGGQSLPGGYGQRPDLLARLTRNNGPNRLTQYFANPEAVGVPAPFTLGTAPRTISSVRVPGTNTGALTLSKEFSLNRLREGANLEFAVETFNALNHPQFCTPNTTVGDGSFGLVTSQCNSPREVQFDLRLHF